MEVLMVMTSRLELDDTGKKADFWLEEFAAPYYAFLDAGAMVTVASPKGGRIPLDSKSDLTESRTELMKRFKKDRAAQAALANTVELADITADDYDAVFYHVAACETAFSS